MVAGDVAENAPELMPAGSINTGKREIIKDEPGSGAGNTTPGPALDPPSTAIPGEPTVHPTDDAACAQRDISRSPRRVGA
jgi:hypothetical protein